MGVTYVDPSGGEAPRSAMPKRTLVTEVDGVGQLLWIEGVLPLPVGARIELVKPRRDAVVTGVRLVATGASVPDLVLDVRLEEAGGAG
jgi:hypothetical protein